MAKVEIIGPKNRFFDVVSLIHELGTLHIEDLTKKIQSGDVPLDTMEVFDRQKREQERMEDQLIRVRAILRALHRDDTHVDPADRKREYQRLYAMDSEQLTDEVSKVIDEVEDRTSALASSHTAIESELALLARYEPILHKIQPLAKQIVTTGAYESVALLVERRYKGALEQLKAELDKLTHKQCEIVSTDVDEDTTAVILVFNRQYSDPVHKFLSMENVNQIRMPNEFRDVPFDVAYDQIKERRKELPQDLTAVSTELEEMSKTWMLKLATVRDVLTDKVDEINAIPKFGRTEYAFVITGWVPVSDVGKIRREMAAAYGDDVIVEQSDIKEEDFGDTPVSLKNPKIVEPFAQMLAGAMGTPRYGTVDPSWFLFFFFPLFYGMIVGDVGYGAIMLAITIWMRLKFRDNTLVQIATSVLGPAATMAFAFGFIYSEFFGLVPHAYLKLVQGLTGGLLPFERTIDIRLFMLLAVAIGAIQVMIGLIIGIVNGVRTKHKSHVMEKGGILLFLVSFIGLILLVALGASVKSAVGGTWALVGQAALALGLFVGIIYAFKGGKVMGVIESVLSLSHVASYIRIMAVGLAGAIFAEAVNKIMVSMGNIVLGILLGIILHTLNFAIAAFSPTIHALRLNFLEFFGNFYETSKEQYRPFTKTGGE